MNNNNNNRSWIMVTDNNHNNNNNNNIDNNQPVPPLKYPIASDNGLEFERKQDSRALPLNIKVFDNGNSYGNSRNNSNRQYSRDFEVKNIHQSRYFTPPSVNETNLGRFEGSNLVIKSDPLLLRLGQIRSTANTYYEASNDNVEQRINAIG